ncbi:fructosamine kinase family protein [Christiangramia echinicola]|uniref:fructosamine kinase family protein n=1 Tax=Christiangramia echinicola TaxID=279359 RepID=UPI0003FC52A9|nr:fructosamine kinase family protein [Christiangramia echinicola]
MSVSDQRRILEQIAKDLDLKLTDYSVLSGGDINKVFLMETSSGKFVIKLNHADRFPGMFDAEKTGLEKLLEAEVIDIPKPIKTGKVDSQSYLVLEYKNPGQKTSDFWEIFGEQLAKLHQKTSSSFGLDTDNYIGSLPQYNETRNSASEFYIEMRLEPQIKMAADNGFQLNVSERFYSNCKNTIPDEPSSLVHGDLWNGNYLVNSQGLPCLIDPAVAFAPRELDLGMMHLFGGFDDRLFKVYEETFPLQEGWRERLDLWKLYYLLVHLNIFGSGYRSQVTSIISKYS